MGRIIYALKTSPAEPWRPVMAMNKAALRGNPDAQKRDRLRSQKTTLLIGFIGIIKLTGISDQT
jgi:hypothetical protein